ncbi:polysaccharide lyase [Musicola keenii]|uniref:polysaccharide lyase n=1 Tax=Musicola keenii TaxID=2884250 RepID=UPI00178423B7|nr:polysaccharide lyase [Musicola keenii]
MNNTRKTGAGRSTISHGVLATTKTLLATAVFASVITTGANAASLQTTKATESASIGWATQSGGTTGGAKASSSNIYAVSTLADFKTALNAGTTAKIIQITGAIDISGGKAYTSASDQKSRSQLSVPSNTTIIGIGSKAKLTNGSLVVKGVSNVILRNIYVETPVDVAPVYEDGDGWNAQWDAVVIDNSDHVWVDHVTISDGSFTDDQYTTKNGETYVQHDGSLDIKKGADYITISNSRFELHDKTILIGHSDSNSSQDSGKLRVTFLENVFDRVTERTPRVRYGSIHAYNNVYVGDVKHSVYPYLYSFGLGTSGSILSEANSFTISNLKSVNGLNKNCSIVKQFNSKVLTDKSSLVNGSTFDFAGECSLTAYKGTIPYTYKVQTMTTSLASSITSNAGYGKL